MYGKIWHTFYFNELQYLWNSGIVYVETLPENWYKLHLLQDGKVKVFRFWFESYACNWK